MSFVKNKVKTAVLSGDSFFDTLGYIESSNESVIGKSIRDLVGSSTDSVGGVFCDIIRTYIEFLDKIDSNLTKLKGDSWPGRVGTSTQYETISFALYWLLSCRRKAHHLFYLKTAPSLFPKVADSLGISDIAPVEEALKDFAYNQKGSNAVVKNLSYFEKDSEALYNLSIVVDKLKEITGGK